ncbi:MAG: hypothetical protein A2428_15830 [Bdellovibrionales bacterium RIFOXYC1_FULL_54_43]|nr:MAG: hypothetical protein A2428_15830 [Bdellovibrionales bacterium RIFOXYC1_FULL_54_43]OFZ85388.1 MAG: hypothetical protein A2603_00750 [Bdellovibrionales bacterium RIFOXYD1_FULL_55_31]
MNYENTARLSSEVDELREKVRRDARELEDQLSFKGISEEIKHRIDRSDLRELWNSFYSDVRRNPLSLILLGSGIALLFRERENREYVSSVSSEGPRESFGGKVSSLGEKVKSRFGSSKSEISERTSEKMHERIESSRNLYAKGREALTENPLSVIGLGLTIGAVIAAALPKSKKEEELLGENVENMKEQVKTAAEGPVDELKSAAG